MKLNIPFDGSKIQITRVRENKVWHGNAVHFRYNGQTYRASIREDPDSEDEFGNHINYAHLQIADNNGNWGDDIATKNGVDTIPISLSQVTKKTSACNKAVPYKFYDTVAFAETLNSLFVL